LFVVTNTLNIDKSVSNQCYSESQLLFTVPIQQLFSHRAVQNLKICRRKNIILYYTP